MPETTLALPRSTSFMYTQEPSAIKDQVIILSWSMQCCPCPPHPSAVREKRGRQRYKWSAVQVVSSTSGQRYMWSAVQVVSGTSVQRYNRSADKADA